MTKHDPAVRKLGGIKLDRPEFRWSRPRMDILGAECPLPVGRPGILVSHAQAALEPPYSHPTVIPRHNPWLAIPQQLQEDPDLQGMFRIEDAKWLFFGFDLEPGCGMYRLLDLPNVNKEDEWLELKLDMTLVNRFASLVDPLDSPDHDVAIPAAIEQVVGFACDYGPLGYGALAPLTPEVIRRIDPEHLKWGYVEPVAFWLSESLTLRAVLQLRKCLEAGRAGLASLRKSLLLERAPDGFHSIPRPETTWTAGVTRPTPGSGLDRQLTRSEITSLVQGAGQIKSYIDAFGVPHIGGDFSALVHAGEMMLQQAFLPKPKGPRPVVSEEELRREALWREVREQAEAELIGVIDAKLSENVSVRSFNVAGHAMAVLPRNLIGAIYLTLARNIASGRPATATCCICGRPLPNRKRIRKLNYCPDGACRKQAQRSRDKLANRQS